MASEILPKPSPLRRANAVWDLPAIPPSTPTTITITLHSTSGISQQGCIIQTLSTIASLKNIVARLYGLDEIENTRVHLMFNGKALKDSDHVFEYGMGNGDVVFVSFGDEEMSQLKR